MGWVTFKKTKKQQCTHRVGHKPRRRSQWQWTEMASWKASSGGWVCMQSLDDVDDDDDVFREQTDTLSHLTSPGGRSPRTPRQGYLPGRGGQKNAQHDPLCTQPRWQSVGCYSPLMSTFGLTSFVQWRSFKKLFMWQQKPDNPIWFIASALTTVCRSVRSKALKDV